MNFPSIENMKWNSGNFYSSKASRATLNMPTPTPAPDRGGPVACLGGRTDLEHSAARVSSGFSDIFLKIQTSTLQYDKLYSS